jgi:hypothetical protein
MAANQPFRVGKAGKEWLELANLTSVLFDWRSQENP